MQTFLPYRSFARSAQVLDPARLGKQRVETLQVLRALELPDYGWANHPAVAMWRGRTPALVGYGLACVGAWRALGHADSTAALITEFAPPGAPLDQEGLERAGLVPSWLGDGPLHLSHRSALVRKDPQRYRTVFGDVPDDLPYVWPGADPQPAPLPDPQAAGEGDTQPLWVVRPPDAAALGLFVGEGLVGLDASSGVDGDALLHRADPPGPGRRGTKALRQLDAFLDQVRAGDDVAVPLAGESALLLGQVTGDYTHQAPRPASAGTATAVVHRRPVAWRSVLPRSAVPQPYLLQDPRALFRVTRRAGGRP